MAVLNRMDWYDLARTTNWTPTYVTEDELFPLPARGRLRPAPERLGKVRRALQTDLSGIRQGSARQGCRRLLREGRART